MKYLLFILLTLQLNFLNAQNDVFRLNYDLENPASTFKLPKALNEISGLSLTKDGNKIVAVQDEKGKVFFINKNNGEVEKDYTFHKDGDYEGIEMVDNCIYVVKSNGNIYEIENIGEANQQTTKHETHLNKSHDVEGLGYDAKRHRLLVACKAVGEASKHPILEKNIYAFDLNTNFLEKEPAFTLHLNDFQEYLDNSDHIHRFKKIKERFSSAEENLAFASSAIAVNPRTQDIYLLSSQGKMLLVLSSEGKILHLEKLDKEIHRQPEGICFDKDGTLYISNEAKKDKNAVIYRFEYQK